MLAPLNEMQVFLLQHINSAEMNGRGRQLQGVKKYQMVFRVWIL